MSTATIKRKKTYKEFYVTMPQSDTNIFQLFAKRMGWMVENKTNLLDKYIASRPRNVDLTDEDIMAEVRAVRYAQ